MIGCNDFHFLNVEFKTAFSLSSFIFFKRLVSPSSFSAIKPYCLHIWGCQYFSRQSWLQLMSHPAQHFAWCTSTAWKLNKQGDNIQFWYTPLLILNQSFVPYVVLTGASWPACRFLRTQVLWSGILIFLRISQFVATHTVKGFSVVNEAEVDFFLNSLAF